jgi:molybdopterin-binding protein
MANDDGDHLMRIGAAAEAIGVSVDTVRRWDRDGRIAVERRGGQRFLPVSEVARLRQQRGVPPRSSARNVLDGTVLRVTKDRVMAQVELACGPYRIVSLMSREAADELGLAPGVDASAVIKSTNVVIDLR